MHKTSLNNVGECHVGSRMNIYPIGIASGESVVWFAWVSDEHDHLMSIDGAAVRASSRHDLNLAVASAGGSLDWEGESAFDVDALISSARSGVGVDPEAVIDFWNFMTDLFRVVENAPMEMFYSELIDTYDVFFSQCGIAGAVGLEPVSISRRDLDALLIVLHDGLQMVINR